MLAYYLFVYILLFGDVHKLKVFTYIDIGKSKEKDMAKITNIAEVSSNYTSVGQSEQAYSTTSNKAVSNDMSTSFLKEKTTAQDIGFINDEIEQTLKLTNKSDSQITNIKIKDTISTGGTFKAGTLKIDNTLYQDYDPVAGYTLPNPLNVNASTEITYTLVISSKPVGDVINNISKITYDVGGTEGIEENSNVAVISVEDATITIQKSADKTAVISGQKIVYQSDIQNAGTVKHTNVKFTDQIPTGTQFVVDSVKIDGTQKTGVSPADGIDLTDLAIGGKTTITFEVTVD